MRVSRAKQIRKYLRFYRLIYGLTPPYSVLLDGNFIVTALKLKLDIKDRLKRVLQGVEVVCCVPRGVLEELEMLGPRFTAALSYAKEHCECVETQDPTGAGAIKEALGPSNEGRYMVASQDVALRSEVRAHMANVPTLFISRAVLLMEAPSPTSRHDAAKLDGSKVKHQIKEEERSLLAQLRAITSEQPSPRPRPPDLDRQVAVFRPKKKAQGPNPLSVKKKKKKKKSEAQRQSVQVAGSKKRKRGRKHRESHSSVPK